VLSWKGGGRGSSGGATGATSLRRGGKVEMHFPCRHVKGSIYEGFRVCGKKEKERDERERGEEDTNE